MLVLSRKESEEVTVHTPQGDIKILVVALESNKVRIGIDAPKDFVILRGEIDDSNNTRN